jgi:hypothetical protein
VHLFELAERGGHPGGWILEVLARQSDLVNWAGKGAQEGNEPVVHCVRERTSGDGVVGDAKSALVVRECVFFIGTQFNNLYTAVDTPAKAA